VIQFAVKPLYLIAPAIGLVIAGGLVGTQRRTFSRLENESALLSQHITAEKDRIDRQSANVESGRPTRPKTTDDKIDWLEIAGMFREMKNTGGVGDMRKMMSFQSRLQKMDTDQLLSAIDQIKELELAAVERMMLESMLIAPLAEKDPELLLNRFSGRLGDDKNAMGWQLAAALGKWAKKDQAAAIAWFDKQIAAGAFDSKSLDGKSSIRLNFETSLIAQLISTDPSAAGTRIAALPADQRKDALDGFGFRGLNEEGHAAYADLVRTHLSEEERYEVFGEQASMIASMGGLEKVGTFLDQIGATGEERIKTAEKAASGKVTGNAYQTKVTEEKIDSMREWLGTQAPGSVERVTGETLGQIASIGSGGSKFSNAAGMALKYHEQGGGDDILTGFLKDNHFGKQKEEARKIAEKISDPKKRAEALENLQ
jgi:hypothetical protein